MNEIRLKTEIDMLQENINRIMVTDDLEEIANMYYYANSRLSTIYRENLDRIRNSPKSDAEELPFC